MENLEFFGFDAKELEYFSYTNENNGTQFNSRNNNPFNNEDNTNKQQNR